MKGPGSVRELRAALLQGMVIPALPLALDERRRFDEQHERALVRYYIDAGAGGVAAGVHSTQFEIRQPEHGLLQPLLALVSETIDSWPAPSGAPPVKIAGIIGETAQAVGEAELARDLGYHAGLLSLAAFKGAANRVLIDHCRAVAEVLPLVGFYLQPAVGGRELDVDFWRSFAAIESVVAIKIAPFDRYRTLDVVRAVCEVGREGDIALYTGNDDNIVGDLLASYRIRSTGGPRRARIVGGLLGHWAIWTRRAVELLERVRTIISENLPVPPELIELGGAITDANAAVFDAAHHFAGAIPGVHEVLSRQGLLRGIWCLDPALGLSPGQSAEIDRVRSAYPELLDDDFVRANLSRWLRA